MKLREKSPWRSLVLAVFVTLSGGPAFGEGEGNRENVESHLRSLLDDRAFQTEWPGGGEVERDPRAGSGRSDRERGRDRRSLQEGGRRAEPAAGSWPDGGSLPRGAHLSVRAFVYMLVAVVAGTLIFALVHVAMRNQRLRTGADPVDDIGPSREPPRSGADPDLEAQLGSGRFGEAAHLLLQKALARLESRSGRRLARSLTSREILRRGGFDEEERESLTTLVEAVERSLFGGWTMTREEYERCAAAYVRLAGEEAAA